MPKASTFTRDNYVCAGRQLQSTAEAKPLHRGDYRQRKPFESIEEAHVPIEGCPQTTWRHLGPIHDVSTETKVGSFRTEQNGAAFARLDRLDNSC